MKQLCKFLLYVALFFACTACIVLGMGMMFMRTTEFKEGAYWAVGIYTLLSGTYVLTEITKKMSNP